MLGVLISLVLVAVMIYMLLNRYQPQFVLFGGGLFLLFISIFLGVDAKALLPAKTSSMGFIWFDPFQSLMALMSNRVATLGMVIMAAGGFAKYMNTIGASRAMVDVVVQPLKLIRSPYVVLVAAFLLGQLLKMFIPSASGLGLLLMVTVFPILMRLGLGPLSSTAAVACTGGIDFGPADSQAILASRIASMDPTEYFVTVLPVILAGVAAVAVVLVVVQIWMDRKAGHTIAAGLAALPQLDEKKEEKAPVFYMILPTLPLVLLLAFSRYGIDSVKMTVVPAMFMSVFAAVLCELVRRRGDLKLVSKQFMAFFEGMGQQFTSVVSLVVAGELFAQGLMAIGAIDTMIAAVQNSGFHSVTMILIMTAFISVITIIMGSGNAAFFSFAALVPKMAEGMGLSALAMIVPLQFSSGIARMMSPISGAMIAEAGIAGISPFDLVRRTFIPMLAGMVVTTLVSIIITM